MRYCRKQSYLGWIFSSENSKMSLISQLCFHKRIPFTKHKHCISLLLAHILKHVDVTRRHGKNLINCDWHKRIYSPFKSTSLYIRIEDVSACFFTPLVTLLSVFPIIVFYHFRVKLNTFNIVKSTFDREYKYKKMREEKVTKRLIR